MSVTASPARATASCAAATNDRPTGNRRNSDVCDKKTRRGDGRSPDMTHSIPARTPPEYTNSRTTVCSHAPTGSSVQDTGRNLGANPDAGAARHGDHDHLRLSERPMLYRAPQRVWRVTVTE